MKNVKSNNKKSSQMWGGRFESDASVIMKAINNSSNKNHNSNI